MGSIYRWVSHWMPHLMIVDFPLPSLITGVDMRNQGPKGSVCEWLLGHKWHISPWEIDYMPLWMATLIFLQIPDIPQLVCPLDCLKRKNDGLTSSTSFFVPLTISTTKRVNTCLIPSPVLWRIQAKKMDPFSLQNGYVKSFCSDRFL